MENSNSRTYAHEIGRLYFVLFHVLTCTSIRIQYTRTFSIRTIFIDYNDYRLCILHTSPTDMIIFNRLTNTSASLCISMLVDVHAKKIAVYKLGTVNVQK